MKNWWLSLFMLVVYLAVFKFWALYPDSPHVYKPSGIIVTVVLVAAMLVASKKQYFAGMTDALAHWLVVLDVFLEAMIAVDHPWWDGLWCAVAFAAVIGGYRAHRLRRAEGPHDLPDTVAVAVGSPPS